MMKFVAAVLAALLFCSTPVAAQFADQANYAGTGAGSANVQTVTLSNAPQLADILGVPVRFKPGATNTGAATLNINGIAATALRKPSPSGLIALTGGELTTGQMTEVVYDGTYFIVTISTDTGSAPLCGATGFTANNNTGTPFTKLDVVAGTAVMVGNSSSVRRTSVSVTIDFGVVGANGIDVGSIASSTLYYLYLIDNGTAAAGLVSLSSTAPTLPSGYTYSCRVAGFPTNGSAHITPIQIRGAQAMLTAGTGIQIADSTGGTCTIAAESVIQVPTTAAVILGYVAVTAATVFASVYRDNTTNISSNLVASVTGVTGMAAYVPFQVPVVAAQTVYYCSNSSSNAILGLLGWIDSVNVN